MSDENPNDISLLADQPIESKKNDKFDRSGFAKYLSQQIQEYQDQSPLVIGIYAPWGSGKSSLLNLILEALREKPKKGYRSVVVRFNPWNFSSIDQLITAFFKEIGNGIGYRKQSATKEKAQRLASDLAIVLKGAAISPIGGSSFGAAAELAGTVSSHLDSDKSLEQIKTDINNILTKSHQRVVVLIDDIDRLEPDSMLLVFKLVRLVADFRNVTYILAMDRQHVESILTNRLQIDGRHYIEKIVQVGFDIPLIDSALIEDIFLTQLNRVLAILEIQETDWNKQRWNELYPAGLKYFILTPRDIVRYINGLYLTLPLISKEVDIVDFIGLEALRTFVPEVYNFIRESREILIQENGILSHPQNADVIKKQIEDIFNKVDSEIKRPSRHICEQLFPELPTTHGTLSFLGSTKSAWRAQKRICTNQFFDRYFYLAVAKRELSESVFRAILSKASTEMDFKSALDKLIAEGKIRRFLERLEECLLGNTVYEMNDDKVANILSVIFNIGDQLPVHHEVMFGIDTQTYAIQDASLLLKRASSMSQRASIMKKIAVEAAGLTTLIEFISFVQPKEDPENSSRTSNDDLFELIDFQEIRDIVLKRIRTGAADGSLSKHPLLGRILFIWRDWSEDKDEPKTFAVDLIKSDDGLLDFLAGFVSFVISSAAGRYPRIDQKNIAQFVDPESIKEHIVTIKTKNWVRLSDEQKQAIDAFLNQSRFD